MVPSKKQLNDKIKIDDLTRTQILITFCFYILYYHINICQVNRKIGKKVAEVTIHQAIAFIISLEMMIKKIKIQELHLLFFFLFIYTT